MAKTKEQRLKEVHDEAMTQFNCIQSALRDERLQCLKDRRFANIAGAQWEGPLGEQFANRPRFEVNKIQLSISRIFSEYRNNRITVDFTSKDGKQDDKLADVCDGLYRADEQDSAATEAYDNAFQEAVTGGFGAWRLRAKYEDEEDLEDDRQRICIEPIYDADSSVFFDLDAKRQDKADAKACYVLTSMSHDAYEAEYGESVASMPKEIHQQEFDWLTPDVVYIAEYYKVEMRKKTVSVWELPGSDEKRTYDQDELDEVEEDGEQSLREQLTATGWKETKSRKLAQKRIHKYILSGAKVLEDCGYIAGKCIPIIPVYGKRCFVDNVERCMGHVRMAADAQRLKNMQLSRLGEISALSAVEKPIMHPEEVVGVGQMWAEDNLKNYPYLLRQPITGPDGGQIHGSAIQYTRAPNIPPALGALLQVTETDMQELLGSQQAGEQLQPNMSGKAVELVQQRLDMQVFIYMDNMASYAMRRCGEVWLSMARELYDEEGRMMKTVSPQNDVGSVELLKPMMSESGPVLENDLSRAKFDVAVEVGPSSSSKRSATVRAITGLMTLTQDPQDMSILTSLALMNMEGEGLSDVNSFYRKKLVGLGVIPPTEEEAQQMAAAQQNQQPTPQDQYYMAAAQNEAAKSAKAQADTIGALADADKTRAETAQIITDIDATHQQQALEIIDRASANLPKPADVTAVVVNPQ